MPVSTSPGGVKTRPHRGTLSAAFALLPILIVILLMLPGSVAFAGSSILEIEPPLDADAHDSSASSNRQVSNSDQDDADDTDATSNHAAASGGNAKSSHDDADDDDDDDDDDQVAS